MSVGSRRSYEALPRGEQRLYPSDLEVPELVRSGIAPSFRKAFRLVYRRDPSGRDYRRLEQNLGGALGRRGGRIVVRANDRLWRGDASMPVPTKEGIYDAVSQGMSWRQRSVIGRVWSLAGRARQLSDEELARELRKYQGESFRVFDPETGRVIRVGVETDPVRFRAFAQSEERVERVISPRMVGVGGTS